MELLILDCLKLDWDEQQYANLLGAFAVMRGQPRLGNAISELPEEFSALNARVIQFSTMKLKVLEAEAQIEIGLGG